jgi:hypothetical protein
MEPTEADTELLKRFQARRAHKRKAGKLARPWEFFGA